MKDVSRIYSGGFGGIGERQGMLQRVCGEDSEDCVFMLGIIIPLFFGGKGCSQLDPNAGNYPCHDTVCHHLVEYYLEKLSG